MRYMAWLISVVIGASLCAAQSKAPEACGPARTDTYSLSFVSSAFKSFTTDGVWGAQIHQFNNGSPGLPQLGDGVSIAVLKLYGLDDLITPINTRTYLRLVIFSFSDRNRVLEKSDQEPRITSLVLDYLEQKKLSDTRTEKTIQYLKGCTKDFSCSIRE